jgi:hypothetical protein
MALHIAPPAARNLSEAEQTRVIAERAASHASRAADRVDNLAAELDDFRADVLRELGAISSKIEDRATAQRSNTKWSAVIVGTIPVVIAILQAFGVLDP